MKFDLTKTQEIILLDALKYYKRKFAQNEIKHNDENDLDQAKLAKDMQKEIDTIIASAVSDYQS